MSRREAIPAAAALAPFVDARTMVVQHGKHHQDYVDNLNKTLAGRPAALASHPLFGSGWVWGAPAATESLQVETSPKPGGSGMSGRTPLCGIEEIVK